MDWFGNIKKQPLEIVKASDSTLITSNPEDMFNVIHVQVRVMFFLPPFSLIPLSFLPASILFHSSLLSSCLPFVLFLSPFLLPPFCLIPLSSFSPVSPYLAILFIGRCVRMLLYSIYFPLLVLLYLTLLSPSPTVTRLYTS